MIRSCCDQVFQVVDRPDPAPPSGRVDDTGRGQVGSLDAGPVGRPAGVDQQFPGVGDRGLGQAGQLPGDLLHPGLGLVPAQLGAGPQPRRDAVRLRAGRPGPVPHLRADRTAGRLDPRDVGTDPTHRLGQQTRVGRVGHVRRDHRGVRPDPAGANHFRLDGLGQQGPVQPVDRPRSAPGGQLHQRGRVRHRAVERDPAEPPPGERIAHFSAQRLVAQPIPELQEHQSQVDLHRRGRPTDPGIEELLERTEKRLIVKQLVHPGQFLGQPQQLGGQDRLPQRHLIGHGTEHQIQIPFISRT